MNDWSEAASAAADFKHELHCTFGLPVDGFDVQVGRRVDGKRVLRVRLDAACDAAAPDLPNLFAGFYVTYRTSPEAA